MSSLKDEGIMWLDDSSVYVADIALFDTPERFLSAVIDHIKELINAHSEEEAGWWKAPRFRKYLPGVTTSWMVHRVIKRRETPFWENIEEPGYGHRPVWYIDFGDDPTVKILDRLAGK